MGSVSHSRVESFLSCKRKEYYNYGEKIVPVDEWAALSLGTAGHSMLEVLYSEVLKAGPNKVRQKKAYPGAVKKMWKALDTLEASGWKSPEKRAPLREILTNYLKREPFIDRGWADDKRQWLILAVEKEFNFEYDPESGGRYPFVVDLIAKSPDGRMIVVDHKFIYRFYTSEAVELMPQIPKYIGALRALGHKVHAGMYNLLRTEKGPVKSVRPPEGWSITLPVEASPARVQRTMTEQIVLATEVENLDLLDPEERELLAVRSAGGSDTCFRMCSYRDLCIEELRGGNTTLLRRTYYKKKPKRDAIEVSDEA